MTRGVVEPGTKEKARTKHTPERRDDPFSTQLLRGQVFSSTHPPQISTGISTGTHTQLLLNQLGAGNFNHNITANYCNAADLLNGTVSSVRS